MRDAGDASPASDLADAAIPPPLTIAAGVSLPALAEAGGEPFNALLLRWRSLLGVATPSPAQPDTVARRVEAALALIAEGQARRILLGRQEQPIAATEADAGVIARQRGALAACCAALRVPRG